MPSLRTALRRYGVIRRPIRLTRRVFWDLAICMVGLGLLVGAIFPPFAVLLGVPPEYAVRPTFVAACLVAGFLVAALNFGLARMVVGRRLAVLSARLRLVADRISAASMCGSWAEVTSAETRIEANSDDALGETARAFNSMLDALAEGEHSRSLVHHSSDVITVVDRAGHVRYQAPSIEAVLGFQPAEVLGSRFHQMVHPDDLGAFDAYLAVLADDGEQVAAVQLQMRHRDGSWRHVETAGTNLLDDPVVAGVVLTTRDVSDRRALEEQLRHLAFHDSLTGLPNRALFLDRVAQAQDVSSGDPAAVIFIDLDNLKMVNDSTGHEGGDLVLQAVAARLGAGLSPGVIAARLGGDEFGVLLVGPDDVAAAPDMARSLLDRLTVPVLVAGQVIHPSMSIGLATSESLGGARDLVRAADAAMFAAKKAGKGRVEVFQPHHHAAEMERQQLRADLQVAVEQGQLVLHYQPIVDLGSGAVSSFEALVRWQHPTRGLVPPLEFIPLAEESDLILSLGGWVLRQACRDATTWQPGTRGAAGPGVKVSVNLSARQFRHSGLVSEVSDALEQAGLDPCLLTVEITETLLLQDSDATTSQIRALQALGVTLALDDFGTGYSSLSYLRKFAINVLKMDKSFLDEVPGNVSDEALVRAIVDLGTTLNLQLVAEGVETAEQAAALASLGCPLGQGYHFARPMTYAQALELVAGPLVPRQASGREVEQKADLATEPVRPW